MDSGKDDGHERKKFPEGQYFLGEVIARTNALKLIHWHITGKGSYAIHISLDTAVEALNSCSDRLIETTYVYEGDIENHSS